MDEETFWQGLLHELQTNERIVFVEIINRQGSAPNAPGAKMYVTLDKSVGTVGGGLVEYRLINSARKKLKNSDTTVEKIFLVHNEEGPVEYKSGMVCSGSQTFAIVPLTVKDVPIVEQILEAYLQAKLAVMTLDPSGINVSFERSLDREWRFTETENSWLYEERIGLRNMLFIVGGGHVSLALSRIMKTLDFHITVLDDRPNLATMEANTFANDKKIIKYSDIAQYIPEGENIYVAIMTFGHRSDELVLEQLINKNVKYLGLMASKNKKQTLFTNLEQKGIKKELLERVHSPIGIPINSITPEEIAISIAAEIIAVKNKEGK